MNKYHAKITVVDGIRFHSKKEANRWCDLQLLQRAGKINNLVRQWPFELVVNGTLIGKYIADFIYTEDGKQIVEDVKSPPTRKLSSYVLKKKLMFALFRITIRET